MENKETKKEFWFEAWSTKNWCGCCDHPVAQIKLTVTVVDGEIEVQVERKGGDTVYAEDYCCWNEY